MNMSDVFEKYGTITVVGLSREETKYSNSVSRFMQEAGYRIIPINPVADVLLGEKAYRSLDEVPGKLEIVDVFRPSEEALGITIQAVDRGAKVVWLQEGIVNEDARRYAESKDVMFIQDKCIMKEYIRWREGNGP